MKAACIIPAYNEAPRIGGVLDVVTRCDKIGQVIVVDDGSSDGTGEVAGSFKGVTLITVTPNRGKSHAVMMGLEAAKHEIVLLLDADLVGLTVRELDRLLVPVLEGAVDMTMSLRKNSLLPYRLMGIDFVSGERAFRKRILGPLAGLGKLRNYGLEVYFNERIIRQRLRLRVIDWKTVISVRKGDKVGFFKGLWLESGMVLQILRTVGLWRVVYQMWKMRSLRQ